MRKQVTVTDVVAKYERIAAFPQPPEKFDELLEALKQFPQLKYAGNNRVAATVINQEGIKVTVHPHDDGNWSAIAWMAKRTQKKPSDYWSTKHLPIKTLLSRIMKMPKAAAWTQDR